MELLHQLVKIHAPSGNEVQLKDFILRYVRKQAAGWKQRPRIIQGPQFQDSFMLVFGKPRTAVFAHMDSIGFTVRYNNQLVKIGGPVTSPGIKLVGRDRKGKIVCTLAKDDNDGLYAEFDRTIDPGTELVFKSDWREDKNYVQCCYMDNRLGVWNALKIAEKLDDGVLVFSCWEEHGGGSVGYLARYLYEELGVQQALISDITWVTEGVKHGKGVAVSMRDRGIPRRAFVEKIVALATKSGEKFQLEVEGAGGSDGGYLQESPYPFDWCFIGAPESNVHSPDEKVHKKDIASMQRLYAYLMKKL